ncbi:Crp/Fnr family transcriptional regulator [Microvirga subterranea]|uniref:CRP-like cAMP-binding protein n=1 Tax=Microvirga subterranea TaxID=186651 RepID=A0A370HGS2_9HYPH|nr:Crp/Fnr family transcriptional regulator [Microvirga subterranea]RDI56818.1 CRP-like cAMP-binding protein [Microvirga subterranea]
MRSRIPTGHRANRLLAALEAEDYAYLEPYLETVELPQGKVLYEPGEMVYHVYFPQDACVSLVNVLEDGVTVEVAMFGREAAFGFVSELATGKAFGRYVVQIAGGASRISIQRLHDVVEARPRIRSILWAFAEALILQTFQMITCNAVHSVEARCCRWILSIHDRLGHDTLPLTHEFLASMLGVQRSTVSVVTRALQSAGLIVQGRGAITITDRDGLERAACECYWKIRKGFEQLLPNSFI